MQRVFGRLAVALALGTLLLPGAPGAIDRGADGKFDERRSAHFRVLQDVDIDQRTGARGSRRFEQEVVETLEDAYRRVHKTLDIRPRRQIDVVIYDPGIFEHSFGGQFRFRAAGFYDGVIHVRGSTQVNRRLVQTLHHEYFHAALDAVAGAGRAPAWLNEGLAEYFENLSIGKQGLSSGEYAYLARAHQHDAWLPMNVLSGPSFAGLDEDTAGLAYLQSYAMVVHLVREHGERRMRDFMRQLIRGSNVEWLLKREYRVTLAELEANVRAEL